MEAHYNHYCSDNDEKFPASSEEVARIISIYKFLREDYGYYPEGIGSDGKIIWRQGGVAIKSKYEILGEANADYYDNIGKKILSKKGGLGRAMKKIKY